MFLNFSAYLPKHENMRRIRIRDTVTVGSGSAHTDKISLLLESEIFIALFYLQN